MQEKPTCLFCLSHDYHEDIEAPPPPPTSPTPPQDHSALFPCACRVEAHAPCLQLWLRRELACPVCRTPFVHDVQTSSTTDVTTFDGGRVLMWRPSLSNDPLMSEALTLHQVQNRRCLCVVFMGYVALGVCALYFVSRVMWASRQ